MLNKSTSQPGSKQATILLADGDVNSAVPLIIGLQDAGFRALHATDGHWALKLARAAQPDLILLNVGLPRMDGLAVCRTLRHSSGQTLRCAPNVPIILIATQEQERIRGLEFGADACLVEPFTFQEMLARVRAVLRRRGLNGGNGSSPGERIVVGDIVLDRATRQVWRAGRPIRLRQREFELLHVLMENAGRAVSRHELLGQVWGKGWAGNPRTRTLDVHVCWLREKLEDDPAAPQYIQTLRGYGHRFVDPALSVL